MRDCFRYPFVCTYMCVYIYTNVCVHTCTNANIQIYVFRYTPASSYYLSRRFLIIPCSSRANQQKSSNRFANSRYASHHAVLSVIQACGQSITHSKLYGLPRARKTPRYVCPGVCAPGYDTHIVISVYVTRFTR